MEMKQKRGRKLLVWLLAAIMLIAFAPVAVLAEEDTVEVILDGNGGVMGAMEEETWEVTVQKGYPIDFDYVVEPVWAGEGRKVFSGWYTEAIEGDLITQDYEVWNKMTIYAHWEDAVELTYNANGGVFKEMDSEVVSVLVAEGSFLGEDSTDNPVWGGEGTKVFDGWYTKAVGGEKIDMDYEVEEDLTVYAHWIDGVEVTFDANGGVFEEEDSDTISDILPKGYNRWLTSYDLEDPVWAGEGVKVFNGWYTDEEDGEPIDEDLIADQDLTIYAQWIDGVTVTYNANGGFLENGEYEATQTLVKGETFSDYGVPKWSDGELKAFAGWYTKASGGDPIDEESVVDENLTVYAHWTAGVVVTYNANGGCFGDSDATVLEKIVPMGSCFGDVEAETPVWFGEGEKIIDGWYTEATDDGSCIDDDYVIDTHMEIYAHWTDAAEIEFITNGGRFPDGHLDDIITVPVGRTFSYDKTPVWDGEGTKVFAGWFTDEEGGTPLDGDYIVEGHGVFFAHWIDGVKVRFYANGGKFEKTGRNKMTVSVEKGLIFDGVELAEDPVWNGEGTKLFDGWYTEATGGNRVDIDYVLNDDLTVYAHWIDGVKVTFNANGGVFKETGEATWTETFPKGFTGFNENYADEPVWNGEDAKLFAGWYTKATGGSRIDDSYAANKNLTVYAHWDEGYLITYKANGGTFENGETEVTQAVAKDSAFINCDTPEWAGDETLAFAGWYTDASDGDLINEESIVDDDLTVYAHWTEGVVVTCNANGGYFFHDDEKTTLKKTVVKGISFGQSGLDNDRFTPKWPEEGEMAFDGWYTEATNGESISEDYILDDNIEIYAQWVDGVLVEYDCNGGLFPDGEGSGREITFPKGSPFSDYKTPVWDGEGTKIFAGWFTDPDGGGLLDENYIVNHHMSVFAHWTDGAKVTFNANGGVFEETGAATWSDIFPKGFSGFNEDYADEPVWNGEGAKVFAGWYTKATGGELIDESFAANNDLTVYAHWNDGYFITYKANGGTFENGKTEVSLPVANGSTFSNYKTPEWEELGTKAFIGWYTEATGGDPVDETSVVNDDLTVYAHWTEGVVVTCNANGGYFFYDDEKTTLKKTVAKESRFGETGIGGSDYTPMWPAEGEKVFAGWYTKAIGGYNITDDYVINKNIEIYAQWVDGVLVEYDCNGGLFPDGEGSGREITFLKGSAFSNYKTPVWDGEGTKTFAGWYTDPVGGELLDANYIVNNHMSVFAHWTDDTISNSEDVTNATVTVSPQTFTYDGKEKTPNVKVVLSGKELKKDTDYTVSFRNNKNAGEALVMITGAGNYCGACNGSFMIEKAASTITLNGATKTYNGKAVDGIKATVGGSSGKIKYTYYSDKACKKAINAPKNAGTYFVKATVSADANYLEATSKAATITIKKAANPLKVKVRSLSVKLKEVQAKDKKFTKKQAFVISKAQGTVVFKKVKGDKKVTIRQDGTVTVKKGAKKGKHIIYVNVTAKGNSNYNKGTQKRIKVTVVVK